MLNLTILFHGPGADQDDNQAKNHAQAMITSQAANVDTLWSLESGP